MAGRAERVGAGTMSILFNKLKLTDGSPYLRVMSTFSGIGAASISWLPIWYQPDEDVYASAFEFAAYAEIAPFPCHVLHYRFGASRPKYMPDPRETNLEDEERKERAAALEDVSHLPATGVTNFGDITQITDDDLRQLGRIDILEGGSPCQAFSFAGARKGLDDPRGNLMLAFCQLAERMREINDLRYVVWENVHGVLSDKTNAFGCLLASLAGEQEGPLQPPGSRWTNAGRVLGSEGRCVAWRTMQASHWGVPQRRKRVFAVANLGNESDGASTAYDLLFDVQGSFRDPYESLASRQAVVATYRSGDRLEFRSAEERARDPRVRARLDAEASDGWIGKGISSGRVFALDMKSQPSASKTAYALTAQNGGNPPAAVYALADDYVPKASKQNAYALMAGSPSGGGRRQMVVHRSDTSSGRMDDAATDGNLPGRSENPSTVLVSPQESGALYARGAKPIGVSSEHNFLVITRPDGNCDPQNYVVRHFTPLECERLQGLPDHWTDVPFKGQLVSDAHRYKAIGNSMACPVISWIAFQIYAAVDAIMEYESLPPSDPIKRRRRGRPPKNGMSAMSAAERQRNRRARLRQEKKASGAA